MRLLSARPKKTEERRRRRYGFVLTFAGLIGLFFVVRTIPADWEIGPFRIDTSGGDRPRAARLGDAGPHRKCLSVIQRINFAERISFTDAFGQADPDAFG